MKKLSLATLLLTGLLTGQALAESLHIGVSNRSLLGLPIVIAKEKGFFEQQGLDVAIDYFAGGVPATAALIGGSVQFIDVAFENNIKAVKKGQPIISIVNLQTDFAGALVVRRDALKGLDHPPTVKDLKGLRVGTLARGGFADVSMRYIAKDAGLDPEKDLILTPIRGADRQLTAGEAGEIDAAFVMEPWNVIAVESSGKWDYVLDLTKGQGPDVFQGLGYTTLQTTRDYVKEHRDTADKVVKALVASLHYIVQPENINTVAEIANKEYGNPGVEVIKTSLQRQLHTFSPQLSESALQKTGHLLLESKSIEAPLPAFSEVVDTSFAPLWNVQ
ncbi:MULTISPECIES: ABC transporter substrate-binding protein [unclassified Brenneria]|uniref:ABC transporter substrate-binding protein n=1 Tax=unclassified Brenneria TaxID=2634434 RepID=UPI0029C167F7|nr:MULTISPECIES: ABC transporter substrate-binding protein [unclassified Brenneria]MDX5628363.1 ABC transporter substrate-binding protein [Brenneria sp. L3-3Z]MDX5695454.1 ABC transporter substrate-binding protein [Brenneria sp. L4-2C]MEE3662303.1 ABC transporter substrate-binding protein [Brenneria sp. g21c3]